MLGYIDFVDINRVTSKSRQYIWCFPKINFGGGGVCVCGGGGDFV